MPTNKKRKNKAPQPEMSGFNHFLKDMQEVLKLMDFDRGFSSIPRTEKERMYELNLKILNLAAGNEHISRTELDYFTKETKKNYRDQCIDFTDFKLSLYQLQLFIGFCSISKKDEKKAIADGTGDTNKELTEIINNLNGMFISKYMRDFYRIITRLSNPELKSYSVAIDSFYLKDQNRVILKSEIYGVPASKSMVSINAVRRPVYRLGKGIHDANVNFEWISLDVSLFGNFYKGCQSKLDVYLQAHVMVQMRKRLDLLDQEAINYALWENTCSIQGFESHRDFLLLPFKIYKIKVGYLVAKIIDEKLIFITFLFITLNSTPEGILLKKLTGLGKEDISYWKIDRLSTFINLQDEEYPLLIPFFKKAGLGNLMQLKDKPFTTESMQAANLDGLTDYINHGKREHRLMTLSWGTPVEKSIKNNF